MSKHEIGMWVRTAYEIKKILEIEKYDGRVFYVTSIHKGNNDIKGGSFEEHIINASHNIIDLLKVGDYVNDNKIFNHLGCLCYFNEDTEEICELQVEDFEGDFTVVTKEQFKSIETVVNEDA